MWDSVARLAQVMLERCVTIRPVIVDAVADGLTVSLVEFSTSRRARQASELVAAVLFSAIPSFVSSRCTRELLSVLVSAPKGAISPYGSR